MLFICYCMLRGRLNVNNAPPPPFSWLASLFEANILPPPWASIMLFEIKSQSPVPDWDFVANFENSLGIISGCIPRCYSKRINICVCVFLSNYIICLPVSILSVLFRLLSKPFRMQQLFVIFLCIEYSAHIRIPIDTKRNGI